MKQKSVRFLRKGNVKTIVVSKETGFGARRESFMEIVSVDEQEERTQDGDLGYSRENRAGVGKCTVNKGHLGMALS